MITSIQSALNPLSYNYAMCVYITTHQLMQTYIIMYILEQKDID